jgi:carbon-monoxide dehydrogenase large subunit
MGLIGERVRRVEDRALLTGEAVFTGDLGAEAFDVHFVRATVAHGRVRRVDVDAARSAPGVVAVFAAPDLGDVRGMTPLPVPADLVRPLMARDHVRFPGEVLAMVVATSAAAAVDAAELVDVDLDVLPVAADAARAREPGAPLLFEQYGTNDVLCIDPAAAAAVAAGAAFDDARLVVEFDMINQRVAAAPMETNAVCAFPTAGGVEVHVSTQAPHAVRDGIAQLCGLDPAAVRVVSRWVGGGFGAKSVAEPEYVLVARAALALGRAVRWRQTRTESLSSVHGRDQHQRVRIAVDADGTLRAIHADIVSDNGAYPGFNHFLATLTARMLPGPYTFEHATSSIRSVATNAAPVLGYRGAGRPEATSLLERAVDVVARVTETDPAELRRRNLVLAGRFPYTTPTGAVYDAGDYARALDLALAHVCYDERRAEQATRRARGDRLQLGIGVSAYVEVTAGAGPTEFADVEVHDDGTATVRVGTFGHGQGHHTTYAQIAADALALPFDAIRVVDGDTEAVARGVGTFGSRSMQVGGSSVHAACGMVVERARELAAALLEAAPSDIVLDHGTFFVAGVPSRHVSWVDVAKTAEVDTAPGDRAGLFAQLDWERPSSTYPFGAHVAIVEVDTETGAVALIEHVAVDDCGTLLNPMLVDGQVHGGIAQGASQALYEEVVRDDDGNVRTASFAEYGIPSAAELPSYELAHTETASPHNLLGAKGIGESGTTGATPAVQNAVIDGLSHLGVRHVDMPCTPERVWRAINGG